MGFQAPVMAQGWDMGASLYPGFNTMANAYQGATTTLGPSLLSYLANQQAKEASLAETARWHDMMSQGQEQQRLANLISAMGTVQAQQSLREQGKAGTVAGMMKDPDSRKGLKEGAYQSGMAKKKNLLNPLSWMNAAPTENQLAQVASQQHDIVNPMVGTAGLQQTQGLLQQLINQQLGSSMVQPGAPVVGGQGGMIRVRLANGMTGTIPQNSFDPATMTLIQ